MQLLIVAILLIQQMEVLHLVAPHTSHLLITNATMVFFSLESLKEIVKPVVNGQIEHLCANVSIASYNCRSY